MQGPETTASFRVAGVQLCQPPVRPRTAGPRVQASAGRGRVDLGGPAGAQRVPSEVSLSCLMEITLRSVEVLGNSHPASISRLKIPWSRSVVKNFGAQCDGTNLKPRSQACEENFVFLELSSSEDLSRGRHKPTLSSLPLPHHTRPPGLGIRGRGADVADSHGGAISQRPPVSMPCPPAPNSPSNSFGNSNAKN